MFGENVTITHDQLIKFYKKENNIDEKTVIAGVCRGVAVTSIPTILLEDLDALRSRLCTLSMYEEDMEQYKEDLTELEKKRINYVTVKRDKIIKAYLKQNNLSTIENLTETEKIHFNKTYQQEMKHYTDKYEKKLTHEDRDLLNLPIYLQSVDLHQASLDTNSHLFEPHENPYGKNILLAMSRVAPKNLMLTNKIIVDNKEKIIETPNIQCIATFSGIYHHYSSDELKQYVTNLHNTIKDFKEPVALLLTNINHAITVGWIPEIGWVIVDANRLYLLDKKTTTHDEVASLIYRGFAFDGPTAFSTEIFAKSTASPNLIKSLNSLRLSKKWLRLHDSKKKAKLLDSKMGSWLFSAAIINDIKTMTALIENGADVNLIDGRGLSPLLIATLLNNTEAVQLLIDHKANVNHTRDDGYTALHYSIDDNNSEMVKLLLAGGANPNLPDNKGVTPFYQVVQHGSEEYVTLMLNQPIIKPNVPISASMDVLNRTAIKFGYSDQLKKLFCQKDVAKQEILKGFTPLHGAICFKHIDIVKMLLRSGKIDIDAVTEGTISALDFALATGDQQIILLIREHSKLQHLISDVKKIIAQCPMQHPLAHRLTKCVNATIEKYHNQKSDDEIEHVLSQFVTELKEIKNEVTERCYFNKNPLSLFYHQSNSIESLKKLLAPHSEESSRIPQLQQRL